MVNKRLRLSTSESDDQKEDLENVRIYFELCALFSLVVVIFISFQKVLSKTDIQHTMLRKQILTLVAWDCVHV